MSPFAPYFQDTVRGEKKTCPRAEDRRRVSVCLLVFSLCRYIICGKSSVDTFLLNRNTEQTLRWGLLGGRLGGPIGLASLVQGEQEESTQYSKSTRLLLKRERFRHGGHCRRKSNIMHICINFELVLPCMHGLLGFKADSPKTPFPGSLVVP